MLEMSKMETWEDLTRMDQSDTASHLINSLEESAFLLADNLNSGSTVSSEDENVGKCETQGVLKFGFGRDVLSQNLKVDPYK